VNFKSFLGVAYLITFVTGVLKSVWIMLGLHMISHSLSALVAELIANTAAPLFLICSIPHTEIVEIIRTVNLYKS